jgi:rhamnogalacturonan endolyase
MFLQSALLATFAFSSSALAAFGITTSGNNIVVDAGSENPFKITVNKNSCDITSILYRGEEFQYQSQGTHISSGLGTATVSSTIVNSKLLRQDANLVLFHRFIATADRTQANMQR